MIGSKRAPAHLELSRARLDQFGDVTDEIIQSVHGLAVRSRTRPIGPCCPFRTGATHEPVSRAPTDETCLTPRKSTMIWSRRNPEPFLPTRQASGRLLMWYGPSLLEKPEL